MADVIMIGYTPLMVAKSQFIERGVEGPINEWYQFVQNNQVNIIGCGFFLNDATVSLVLVLDNDAQKIYDHLCWWSENDPDNWFDFNITIANNGYAVCVSPNHQKSIDRFKKNHNVKSDKIVVLFNPLSGVFNDLQTIGKITKNNKINQEKITVYFANADEINTDKFSNRKLELKNVGSTEYTKKLISNLPPKWDEWYNPN